MHLSGYLLCWQLGTEGRPCPVCLVCPACLCLSLAIILREGAGSQVKSFGFTPPQHTHFSLPLSPRRPLSPVLLLLSLAWG